MTIYSAWKKNVCVTYLQCMEEVRGCDYLQCTEEERGCDYLQCMEDVCGCDYTIYSA